MLERPMTQTDGVCNKDMDFWNNLTKLFDLAIQGYVRIFIISMLFFMLR